MGRGPLRFALLSAAVLAVGVGCNQSDFGDDAPVPPENTPDGPGDEAWGEVDVTCEGKSDCASNEECIDNVCQMPRCDDGPYASAAPLGPQHYFFSDRELIAADDNFYQNGYWVDTYLPGGSTLTYPTGGGSWKMSGSKVIDVAGGNVLGTRPERFVVATAGDKRISVNGSTPVTMTLSFVPIAVATGDVDHDSVDEIIAFGAGGQVALCEAIEARCTGFNFEGSVVGKDVAAADIDGDGYDEPIFFIRKNGKAEILAWNPNAEDSGEESIYGIVIDTDYLAIDAGDTDGNGVAEVFALEDGGWLGFAKDHVHIWNPGNTSRLGNQEVDADSKDITVADLDMSGADELLVLRDTKTVEVYRGTGAAQLSAIYTADLSASTNPTAIAAADTDGDTPSARRISENPELIASKPVPVMVLNFPPYSRSFSDGLPYLFAGDGENFSEDFTDTVGLHAGVELGVGVEFPGVFSAEVSAGLRTYVNASRTLGKDIVVGQRFKVDPRPDLHGESYSVVMLSSACYHAYKYELDDPTDAVGGDGGEFVMVVPVGGQSTIWSSNRYNALAEALGTLPIIENSGATLGDPSSYPTSPTRANGDPVPPRQMVFPEVPSFLTSDVGTAGWWLSVNESVTNDESVLTEVSVKSSIKVAGFKVGSTVGGSWGKGYSIGVGQYALFGGGVPPIPDNPDTPEDEYEANRYTFSPYVYRELYDDSEGEETGYYVLNFATGK